MSFLNSGASKVFCWTELTINVFECVIEPGDLIFDYWYGQNCAFFVHLVAYLCFSKEQRYHPNSSLNRSYLVPKPALTRP
jgi:hypothetical protein